MRLDWAVIKRHPELVQVGAEIWLALASSGAHIVPLTKDSAIWTDEEKFRYSLLSDARDGIAHILNSVVPERYLRMTEFQTFAELTNCVTRYVDRYSVICERADILARGVAYACAPKPKEAAHEAAYAKAWCVSWTYEVRVR
jgi:hypothetical protein